MTTDNPSITRFAMTDQKPTDAQKEAGNLDPISKAPGAHPVGTGIGATAGGVAGIAAGVAASSATGVATGTVLGGPAGAVVGLVAGAVIGGLAGKAVGEQIDPTVEDAYWKQNHSSQAYAKTDDSYSDFQPAYRSGYLGRSRYPEQTYEAAEASLEKDFESDRAGSSLDWQRAKAATKAAWDRATPDTNGNRTM